MPHASHGLFGCGAMMSAMSTLAKLSKKCDHVMRASAAGARPQDDKTARRRYEFHGFRSVWSYLHIYIDSPTETRGAIAASIPGLSVCQAFAHYVGDRPEMIRQRFSRVHECRLYRQDL